MKTQKENTQESQHSITPIVSTEASNGGTAQLKDNRTSSIDQRKLRSGMDSTEKGGNISFEKPKGSLRFQQIASQMGQQYGVDTSTLKATHNSSFPNQLNAEATIQANNIHFAPGKDTDYNIKHEVAHAIDNTLHGTPKGNHFVNGYAIDTTREQHVDRMARTPVKNQGLSIQRKAVPNFSTIGNKVPVQRTVRHANTIRSMCVGKTDRSQNGVALNPAQQYTSSQDIIQDYNRGGITINIMRLLMRAMGLDRDGKTPAVDTHGNYLPIYDPMNRSVQRGNALLNYLQANNHPHHYALLNAMITKINRVFGMSALPEFWSGGHIVFNDNGTFYQRLIALAQPLAVVNAANVTLPKNNLAGYTSSHVNYPTTMMGGGGFWDANSQARTAGAMMTRRPANRETSHYPGNAANFANLPAGVPNPPPQYGVDMPSRMLGFRGEHVLFGLTYTGKTFVQTEGAGFQNFFQGSVMHGIGGIKNVGATVINQGVGREVIKPQTGMFGSSNLSEKGNNPRFLDEANNNTVKDTFMRIMYDLMDITI
ncbi:hypothetical protein GCM10009430_02960 [Aquimarina litoralis]|uniref:DUF4157 domain-containing protein n=1 Tax=Aquimarina litoralis TaxID=584605 RepID=A0ABN1IG11_9FLAO